MKLKFQVFFVLLEFQYKVLHKLTEILEAIKNLGKQYEPADSPFLLEQIDTMENFNKLELELSNKEFKTSMVNIYYPNQKQIFSLLLYF